MDKYSFLNAAHTSFFSDLYEKYLRTPDAIEPSWRAFFQGFDFGQEMADVDEQIQAALEAEPTAIPDKILKEFNVVKLINAYRSRGHLFTKTNPVRSRRTYTPTLDITNFGLNEADLESIFDAGEILGLGAVSLREIIQKLETIYCEAIGVEYMYIRTPERIEWIQNWLNKNLNHPVLKADQKKHILKKLTQAVTFESFLHTKYVGQKRFSLEGNESLIPALDAIVERASEIGVKEFVMGMAHRGRLNVLTNIFGKSAQSIFGEFDGKDYQEAVFDGDVKYHLGWTSERQSDGGANITMNIAPNPSHLETVGAVVEGITRSKQDQFPEGEQHKVLPIVVHGDAAIAGQGIVYEIVQMAQLDGYKTGGTIHIVVNNQIGFTTNYLDARSSTYCTDVGKVTLSPVLHVNADDAEAVVHAALFALEYRMRFKSDVFIDLLGYRKYGHNEGDEPRFTQPILYKKIAKHSNPKEIYFEKLLKEGIVDQKYVDQLEEDYKQSLEVQLEDSRKETTTVITPFMQNVWNDYPMALEEEMLTVVDTSYPLEDLKSIAASITQLPEGKKFIRKIQRLVEERRKMVFENNRIDWAMGELLAYGSLLKEGCDVRISGQDVERGTFSHRHAVIKVEDSEEEVVLLDRLAGQQGQLRIYNSLLSEYGVLGFDYGYAMANPNALTIWEAQFGDFSNGAQIMIDQYISAAEDKWKLQNGLVMLLPHGYEGQGAEHSSARMERYLQLCAKDNMFIADCTTPANMFHLLRRQLKASYRKPLVVFTPKSLLRHPLAMSSMEELANGQFQELIDDHQVDPSKVNQVVFCTGKFYYDLYAERDALGKQDTVALIRLEQLFPLPTAQMDAIIKKYANATDRVWAQEEPKNMGAWGHLMMHYSPILNFRVASRRMYAAPAAGSPTRSKRRHQEVIDYVFDATKNNNK